MDEEAKGLAIRTAEKIYEKIENFFYRKIWRIDASELFVYGLIGIYTVVFSYATIQRHHAFKSYAWDLGIFNQAFWTTLKDGKLFYYTPELFLNPSGRFFAVHFSPILFLALPSYAVYPSPETLLVIQSFVLASSALPLYKFAERTLNNRSVSVAIVLAYFLYTPLHGINWFDFHPQLFLPLLLFSTLYYLKTGKWLRYFTFIILSLMVAENASFVVIFIGIYCLWLFREKIRDKNVKDKEVFIPFITIGVATIWFFIVIWVQRTFFPIDTTYLHLYKAVNNWSVLGIEDDPLNIPLYVLLRPWKGLEALAYDAYLKLLYIIILFGPLLFLSFKSRIVLITLVWLGPALLSNYQPYYLIGTQYPAYVIPFIFMSGIEGIRKKMQNSKTGNIYGHIKNILILGMLFTIFTSPLSPLITTLHEKPFFTEYSLPNITTHEEMLRKIISFVPSNSSVLTQNNIFPHFSSRANAYVYPVDPLLQQASEKINSYIGDLFKKSEYVLVDTVSNPYIAGLIISEIEEQMRHGLYAFVDGIYLYKQGYKDYPLEVSL